MSSTIPFRYDIVGSFLRPDSLKSAIKKFQAGEISLNELKQIQQDSVLDLIEKEAKVGLKCATDGEFTRFSWHHDFIAALNGIGESVVEGKRTIFQGIEIENLRVYQIQDTISFPKNHPFLSHFAFLKENTPSGIIPKQTIPGPNMIHMGGMTSPQSYLNSIIHTDFDRAVKEISSTYQDAIQQFYNVGCRYLQLDDTAWAGVLEPDAKEKYKEVGINVEEVIEKFTYLTKESIKNKPSDLALTFHVCRGNFQSSYLYHGAYDNIAKQLFSIDQFDGFFLEFDDQRSGDFSCLKHVKNQKIVLGLITSKTPELEDKNHIIERIHEAAKYLPLDQLCLSPQCGFASTAHGNKLTEQDQWNKLLLTKEIAESVWKDA